MVRKRGGERTSAHVVFGARRLSNRFLRRMAPNCELPRARVGDAIRTAAARSRSRSADFQSGGTLLRQATKGPVGTASAKPARIFPDGRNPVKFPHSYSTMRGTGYASCASNCTQRAPCPSLLRPPRRQRPHQSMVPAPSAMALQPGPGGRVSTCHVCRVVFRSARSCSLK